MTQIPMARPRWGSRRWPRPGGPFSPAGVVQRPEVEAFEKEFAAWVGAPQAVACSSGTAALQLALLALNLQPGDEVITVSHAFIATANAVRYLGATQDVEYLTGNLDPDLIALVITDRTKVILAPHQLGMPCDLERILPLAREHNLLVVEDAACAIGSEIKTGSGAW